MSQVKHHIIAAVLGHITWYGFLSKHPIMQKEMKQWRKKIESFLIYKSLSTIISNNLPALKNGAFCFNDYCFQNKSLSFF